MKTETTHTFRLSHEQKDWLIEFSRTNETTPGMVLRRLLEFLQRQAALARASPWTELLLR